MRRGNAKAGGKHPRGRYRNGSAPSWKSVASFLYNGLCYRQNVVFGSAATVLAMLLLYWGFLAPQSTAWIRDTVPRLRQKVVVAVPVSYATVPAFLVGARSIAEQALGPAAGAPGDRTFGDGAPAMHATDPLPVVFAVLADSDIAWREIQGSCPCYLSVRQCDAMVRVPAALATPAPALRSAASRAPGPWEDPAGLAAIRRTLTSLASCASVGPAIAGVDAILVLPDPHFLAVNSIALMLEEMNSASNDELVAFAGGALGAGADSDGMANAEVLLVNVSRWRALLQGSLGVGQSTPEWASCPLDHAAPWGGSQ